MCTNFLTASTKAKVLNGTFILLNFLAWVCCWVSFVGKLVHVSHKVMGGTIERDYYWNRAVQHGSPDTTIYFDHENCVNTAQPCDKCTGGGRGLIALQVFAFLGLTVVLTLSIMRVIGASIPALGPTRKSLLLEFALTGLNTFWFFLSVCVYGGMCFHSATKMTGYTVTGTGFGYLVACFFFLIINIGVAFALRSDATTHLGSNSGSDYAREASSTTDYHPPAGYQYNADATAAYAGSYHSDVQPATAQPVEQNL